MKQLILVLSSVLIFSCVQDNKKELTANSVINQAIDVSGGDKFGSATIQFDFRDKHYSATRHNGLFELVRKFNDSVHVITDFLTNKGFERYVNNSKVVVLDSMIPRYSSSVNSVHYFSVLPYGLNDKAVNKELLGEVVVNGHDYYKIKVTFDQEGGGEDFEDIFVYWVNKNSFKVDYLAYSYEEADGVGLRFREAYNERYVNGLRFVDYNNYKPSQIHVSVPDLDKLFENKELKLLSKIELKNITVD
ncbi:DUF6503 family protein [Hanstruepera marina]|uniref:DUF6503 family protein n=1 Tax=Hanstruepera marina TaxID=2873265 RepID=UPI001CA73BE7|nr:DUF6503 family protein [Hanstruepera marina]